MLRRVAGEHGRPIGRQPEFQLAAKRRADLFELRGGTTKPYSYVRAARVVTFPEAVVQPFGGRLEKWTHYFYEYPVY
jgi:hypothetical protein